MRTHHLAAIDLGASSGRVMLATFTRQDPQPAATLTLKEIHRFPNNLIRVDGHETWDLDPAFSLTVSALIPGVWITCCLMNRASGSVCQWLIVTTVPKA